MSRRSRTCRRVWQRCPGGVHRAATQRSTSTPPCPGPRRGRTNWPAIATVVVSIGRASARPSDARRRRGRRDTTTIVGPLPRWGRSPGLGLAPGVSAASCPLPRDAAVSGRSERVRGARSPSCCRHARVVRPAPRPCRRQGMAARPFRVAADARADVGRPARHRCGVRRAEGRPPRRRTSRAYRTGKRRRPDPRGDPACGVRRRPGQWANLPRENS